MRLISKKRARLLFCLGFVATLGTTGCVSYTGVRPTNPGHEQTVDDLQPVIRWKPDPDPAVTHDIVIYEPKPKSAQEGPGIKWQQRQAYYREGLTGSEHRVEQPLESGKAYTWSVRARRGDDVSNWTKREAQIFLIFYHSHTKRLLRFSTPKK